jgi:hypothetical protein
MLRAVLLPPETSGVIGAPQAPRRPSRWRGPRFPLGSSELRDPKVAQEVRARAVRLQRPGFGAEQDEKRFAPSGAPAVQENYASGIKAAESFKIHGRSADSDGHDHAIDQLDEWR